MRVMPWPTRIVVVRWLTAARNTSGAVECEYSSRKWCSWAQPYPTPHRSPSSAHSSAFLTSVSSLSGPHGLGSWSSKNIPNRMGPPFASSAVVGAPGRPVRSLLPQKLIQQQVHVRVRQFIDDATKPLRLAGEPTLPGELLLDLRSEVLDGRRDE